MPRLHQILAIEGTTKAETNRAITDAYQRLQKGPLLSGISKTYAPLAEDGDRYPSESTLVQVVAKSVLDDVKGQFNKLFDLTATKDFGNMTATADVVLLDGTVLIEKAPATYLLWLEKQLTDLSTVVRKLPVLDPSEVWSWSDEAACYVTQPAETAKSKKVPRVLSKAKATDKHPEQVEVWQEDIVVGYWSTTKFSGALQAKEVQDMFERIQEVRDAVKIARSTANETEVESRKIAGTLLTYIFG